MLKTIIMSFIVNLNQSPIQNIGENQHNEYANYQLDTRAIAKEFCNIYYLNAAKGLTNVLHLFDQNAFCNYCGKEYLNMYNVMVAIASDGIASLKYDNLSGTVLPIDKNKISVQIVGSCKGVTFWNQTTATKQFNETFILTLINDRIFVTSYSFRLL